MAGWASCNYFLGQLLEKRGDAQGALAAEYEQALMAYARAATLDPTLTPAATGRLVTLILREDWSGADEAARVSRTAADPSRRWLGAMYGGVLQLLRGKSQEALTLLNVAADTYSQPAFAVRSRIRSRRKSFSRAVSPCRHYPKCSALLPIRGD